MVWSTIAHQLITPHSKPINRQLTSSARTNSAGHLSSNHGCSLKIIHSRKMSSGSSSSAPMTLTTVNGTPNAPAAIGPYSQAVVTSNGLIYSSGSIPLDPSTMKVVDPSDVELQTEQCLKNLSNVLVQAGGSLKSVIKVTVFIKDMNQFSRINAVYGKFFNDHKPARSCVEVARLPLDVLVEIEAIALKEN